MSEKTGDIEGSNDHTKKKSGGGSRLQIRLPANKQRSEVKSQSTSNIKIDSIRPSGDTTPSKKKASTTGTNINIFRNKADSAKAKGGEGTGTGRKTASSSASLSVPSPGLKIKQKPKMPHYTAKPKQADGKKTFSQVEQINLHHQSTSIHFTFNCEKAKKNNGSNEHCHNTGWSCIGTTSLYLSHTPGIQGKKSSSLAGGGSTHTREVALHLRGSSSLTITNATVHLPLPSVASQPHPQPAKDKTSVEQQQKAKPKSEIKLHPMRATVSHHDPLSKIFTKPAETFTPLDYLPLASSASNNIGSSNNNGSSSNMNPSMHNKQVNRRYEADTHCLRGGNGMMEGMRCASIASYHGEMRVKFICPSVKVGTSKESKQLWKNDLMAIGTDEDSIKQMSEEGELVQNLVGVCNERGGDRRLNRIELISDRMTSDYSLGTGAKRGIIDASSTDLGNSTVDATMAFKITIQFQMDNIDDEAAHFGGIHFNSPKDSVEGYGASRTPHVYTTTGIFGDHQGVRSWIPTIDSISSSHRASHDLTVKVTADAREGLWAAGCGEHFGVNKTVLHHVPVIDETKANVNVVSSSTVAETDKIMEKAILKTLGKSSVDLIARTFKKSSKIEPIQVHIIPQERSESISCGADVCLATNVWTTSIWNPCPSRSLGFAIGPFNICYDPEYFSKDIDEDDEEDEDAEKYEEDDDFPTIQETAENCGEGIRQLYFAMRHERCHIHSNAKKIGLDNGIDSSTPSARPPDCQDKRKLLMSVVGSTAGVPNRALSLMRDILSLPSYRTASYTQIFIPNAIDGGSTCGSLHSCPEISCNPFLGGAILDATLLPPPGYRLPFHAGGRALQFLQARCAVRGWITAALPLGGSDEIGHSYIPSLFEHFIMSLYERAHGGAGEGGSKHSFFFSKRYQSKSGLNSRVMDFLPINNVEEDEMVYGIAHGISAVGALPDEDNGKEEMWRNISNGTESHTSSLDEFSVRQLLAKDVLEGIERMDKSLPSPGWLGSLLSATFLTSNSTSSSKVGCGALELMHPVGGTVYRDLKCRSLRKVIEGRIGVANFVRVVRAAFVAAILEDKGLTKVDLPEKPLKGKDFREKKKKSDANESDIPKPLFVLCVDELVKKGGFTHGSLTRTIRVLSGPARENYLRGMLVDVSRDAYGKVPSEPEGFPNSFVRGSSGLYLRVGIHVEPVVVSEQQNSKSNHLHVHVLAEPVIFEGGIAFGGPITIRIVERGGQCRDFVRNIESDGSRSDFGHIILHGEPVTSAKNQTAASGTIETNQSDVKMFIGDKSSGNDETGRQKSLLGSFTISTSSSFDENQLHRGGYQALELVRLMNRTPLLWVRVDPHGLFDSRIALCQQDACLGEQLFHDGEAGCQVEALRALAERPLRLQSSKVKNLLGVPVSELPVRLLGDCLRGSVALHADLPHNPAIRAEAALAIAQWQNNKAPMTKDTVGWVGLQLLVQYLDERYFKDGMKLSAPKFSRICCKMKATAQSKGTSAGQSTDPNEYQYLDVFKKSEDRLEIINGAISIEREDDEEYRVRSAVVTAIACIRAKDGMTPPPVIRVLEKIIQGDDESVLASLETINEGERIREKKYKRTKEDKDQEDEDEDEDGSNIHTETWIDDIDKLPYSSSTLIADALLALCFINTQPELVDDPVTGKQVQSRAKHPCLTLMDACFKWLEWDLYKESIRLETEAQHLSAYGRSIIAPCAITALCSLVLLRQCTTDSSVDKIQQKRKHDDISEMIETASSAKFYIDIFNSRPIRPDATRAAAAQAVLCICCARDRTEQSEPFGLLTGLELACKWILEPTTPPGLRQTLALLMIDACTGKICSTQRAALLTRKNDLLTAGSYILNGPLGASYGCENGSSLHTTVSESSMPAASAVNDGARRGLHLLRQAGGQPKPGQKFIASESTVVRVATLASNLWRTINGEMGGKDNLDSISGNTIPITSAVDGVCAHDGYLRCSLLSLWQRVWPKGCIAILRVQSWKEHEGTQRYKNLGADEVMKIDESEKKSSAADEAKCSGLRKIVASEIDRQRWRGGMARERRQEILSSKDGTKNSQGVNFPLHIVPKDTAWKHGGWIASAAQHRRTENTDGGSSVAVTKLRLSMNKGGD